MNLSYNLFVKSSVLKKKQRPQSLCFKSPNNQNSDADIATVFQTYGMYGSVYAYLPHSVFGATHKHASSIR